MGEHVAGNLRPVDAPSGVAGELVEHDVLTARVHVAERMNRGRLAPHPGEPIGERIRFQPVQVFTLCESAEDALGLGRDERRAAVRDAGAARMGVGVAEVTTPHIQVLRQVPMDRLQVGEVEAAGDRVLGEFDHALMDRRRLDGFPTVVVGDAELVDKNPTVRVAVAVGH